MRIKRQPFWAAVRIGIWLHLALAVVLLFQTFITKSGFSLIWNLGLVIDWIVGSIYSRYYLRTWPVHIFIAAAGGLAANVIARCVAGMVLGIAYFFNYTADPTVSFSVGARWVFSLVGTYIVYGVIFGAVGGAWTVIRNKRAISGVQTFVLLMTILSLWSAQFAFEIETQDLYPRLTPIIVNWIVAGLAVLTAFYIENRTDSINARELGQMLILAVIGSVASLAYSYVPRICCENLPITLHGYPFGIELTGLDALSLSLNLLFWFNISLLLVGFRRSFSIRAYSHE